MSIEHNPEYLHHSEDANVAVRELVFGMEDGMVSTLGAVIGIASATQDAFTTVLAGLVVVSVESISMGVGSYLSSKSVLSIQERKLAEEREELKKFPAEEKEELIGMYVSAGWKKDTAALMAEEASANHDLFLEEMALRELRVFQSDMETPFKNGVVMGVSYVAGGLIPLFPYFFFPISSSIAWSLGVTFIALFLLGVYTTKFSKRVWWRAGVEMLGLASAAAFVGYFVGQMVDQWWLR